MARRLRLLTMGQRGDVALFNVDVDVLDQMLQAEATLQLMASKSVWMDALTLDTVE